MTTNNDHIQVACTGSEVDFLQCPFNGWGMDDCGHSEDVYVCCRECSASIPSSPPRGGDEIEHEEAWQPVAIPMQQTLVLINCMCIAKP